LQRTISNLNHLLAWNEAVFAGPVSAVVEALVEILFETFFLSYLMLKNNKLECLSLKIFLSLG
jgi:hypothetical protein